MAGESLSHHNVRRSLHFHFHANDNMNFGKNYPPNDLNFSAGEPPPDHNVERPLQLQLEGLLLRNWAHT